MAELVCTECMRMVVVQPRVNFMGFPKFQCPLCRHQATHPLATWRLVVYAIIAGLGVIGTVAMMAQGGIPIMGVIPALMMAAVIINFGVKSRVDAAMIRARSNPPPPR
ncbi:MAG: hypothetical protein H0V17_36170 [Deltaproteobacteria bacterium]|nr:hypothetical protein [Deltaproteobacteria bacterium]